MNRFERIQYDHKEISISVGVGIITSLVTVCAEAL